MLCCMAHSFTYFTKELSWAKVILGWAELDNYETGRLAWWDLFRQVEQVMSESVCTVSSCRGIINYLVAHYDNYLGDSQSSLAALQVRLHLCTSIMATADNFLLQQKVFWKLKQSIVVLYMSQALMYGLINSLIIIFWFASATIHCLFTMCIDYCENWQYFVAIETVLKLRN